MISSTLIFARRSSRRPGHEDLAQYHPNSSPNSIARGMRVPTQVWFFALAVKAKMEMKNQPPGQTCHPETQTTGSEKLGPAFQPTKCVHGIGTRPIRDHQSTS